VVHPGAFLGGPAQHRVRGGGELVLGSEVEIWEAATLHRGSAVGSGTTRLGDRVLVMAYGHVGHDVEIGDDAVLSNGAQLGGHAVVGARAVLGARAAVHQFVRIGQGAMVAAGALVSGDVPPWTLVAGDRARIVGPNRAALGSREAIEGVRSALRLLRRGGRPEDLDELAASCPPVHDLADFPKQASRRAPCGWSRRS